MNFSASYGATARLSRRSEKAEACENLAQLASFLQGAKDEVKALRASELEGFDLSVNVGSIGITFVVGENLRTRATRALGSLHEREDERIEIESGSQRGSAPRFNSMSFGCIAPYEGRSIEVLNPTLWITIVPDAQDDAPIRRFTDRNTVWLRSGTPGYASMSLQDWDDPSITEKELVEFVCQAEQRVGEVIEAVLSGGLANI